MLLKVYESPTMNLTFLPEEIEEWKMAMNKAMNNTKAIQIVTETDTEKETKR